MLDYGEDVDKIRSIKMALMGPLAGIGDAISQFGIAPLFSTILQVWLWPGVTGAPIMFLVTMIGVNLAIKLGLGWFGYKMGTSAIETLSQENQSGVSSSKHYRVTVISGLAVNFVKANVGCNMQQQLTVRNKSFHCKRYLIKFAKIASCCYYNLSLLLD
ncbi:PTS system mannose/fructose/sorbose family transporter subunit IID [Jeotgalibaca ciconiae]|uniref:PTS system mannose/fructose/sorbose family transporter subunit IID n=1 Tax=Jeotgalibaca ciconiae TaxID=2496265 RepID=UPI00223DB824|nr:PTS system mannose/fructose/sorbose family transporter subunit IID [Jeotgalibaca ciconiae]